MAVLMASADWQHLNDQARQDWWLPAPIIVGFGTQVALTVELRRRHRAQHLAATTGPRDEHIRSRDGRLLRPSPRRPRATARRHRPRRVPVRGCRSCSLASWSNAVAAVVAARRLNAESPPLVGSLGLSCVEPGELALGTRVAARQARRHRAGHRRRRCGSPPLRRASRPGDPGRTHRPMSPARPWPGAGRRRPGPPRGRRAGGGR